MLARVSLSLPSPPTTNISWEPSDRGRTTLLLQDRGVCRDTAATHLEEEEEEEEEVDWSHTWHSSVDTRAPRSEDKFIDELQ